MQLIVFSLVDLVNSEFSHPPSSTRPFNLTAKILCGQPPGSKLNLDWILDLKLPSHKTYWSCWQWWGWGERCRGRRRWRTPTQPDNQRVTSNLTIRVWHSIWPSKWQSIWQSDHQIDNRYIIINRTIREWQSIWPSESDNKNNNPDNQSMAPCTS